MPFLAKDPRIGCHYPDTDHMLNVNVALVLKGQIWQEICRFWHCMGRGSCFSKKKKIHVAKAFGNWVKGDEGWSKCLMEKYTAEMLFNSLAKPTAPERDQTRYILRFDLKHIQ